MKTLLLSLACALVTAASLQAVSNDEVAARKVAYEVAGAFTNDGFKMRDGCWAGKFELKKPQLIQVNLYAGNQYWFSASATEPAKKIGVSVYDETGKQMTTEGYDNGERAAAGFAPSNSGQYFVSIDLVEGEQGTFCLVYSYK